MDEAMGLPGWRKSKLQPRPTDRDIRTAQSTATAANPTSGRFGSTPTGSPSHTMTRRQCGRVMTRDHPRWPGIVRNDQAGLVTTDQGASGGLLLPALGLARDERRRDVVLDDLTGHDHLRHVATGGHVVHHVEEDLLDDGAQPA